MSLATDCQRYSQTIESGSRADFLGILCSLSCAVHCAALPIAVSFLPTLASLHWLSDPLFHQTVAVACFAFVLQSIVPVLSRSQNSHILAVTTTGLVMLFIAAFILPDGCSELSEHQHFGRTLVSLPWISSLFGSYTASFLAIQSTLTPIGSALLVVAHILNIRAKCCAKRSCG